MTYINCSAEVKALSDIIVTSSSAEKIINSIPGDREILFASRDRFGIKPLYYYFDKFKNLYFASEIKQFFLLKQWNASLNVDRAYDYIMFAQTDHTNETLFKNVFNFPML